MDKEKVLISDLESVKAAASQILDNSFRCVVVVNAAGKVKGVFSEGDILRAMVEGTDPHAPLKSIMRPSFHYLSKRDLHKAFLLIKKFGITLIPIVDKEFMLQDIVTFFDLVPYLKMTKQRTTKSR